MCGPAEEHPVLTEQLLEELETGQGEDLRRLARYAPSNEAGSGIHSATLHRWIMKGVKVPSGKRIRLEAARLGGKWVSTRAALRRFILAQNPDLPDGQPRPIRSAGKRRRASERAAEQLSKIGI
jgi:hypothetical protein